MPKISNSTATKADNAFYALICALDEYAHNACTESNPTEVWWIVQQQHKVLGIERALRNRYNTND